MNSRKVFAIVMFCFAVGPGCFARSSSPLPVPRDPLSGTGIVNRPLLTYKDLFSDVAPSSPVDDSAFALPANAAMPKESFEGRLELLNPASSGGFTKAHEDFNYTGDADSPWRHLPAFSFEFVQNGSHLIPVRQGLIVTGNPSWNYIVGPGRVWREDGDSGYTRARYSIGRDVKAASGAIRAWVRKYRIQSIQPSVIKRLHLSSQSSSEDPHSLQVNSPSRCLYSAKQLATVTTEASFAIRSDRATKLSNHGCVGRCTNPSGVSIGTIQGRRKTCPRQGGFSGTSSTQSRKVLASSAYHRFRSGILLFYLMQKAAEVPGCVPAPQSRVAWLRRTKGESCYPSPHGPPLLPGLLPR